MAAIRCVKCETTRRGIASRVDGDFPDTGALVAAIEARGFLPVALEHQVSDAGLKKILRRRGVDVDALSTPYRIGRARNVGLAA